MGGGLHIEVLRNGVEDGSGLPASDLSYEGEMTVRITMASHTKLGGWMPQALVNSATGTALRDVFVNYLANLSGFSEGAEYEMVLNEK